MEGGGGGVLRASQEPREEKEDKVRAAEDGIAGAGMKFRMSARAPHGVGVLLLIGGAVLAGAAAVAWRHARRRGKDGNESRRERQPAKEEVLDGGVVEDGKVQDRAAAPARESDLSDENLSGDKEKAEMASNLLMQDGKVPEEIQQIHEDSEIVADELDSEPADKFDDNSSRNPAEISMHDVDDEHVEKFDQNLSSIPAEMAMHDVDSKHAEKFDHNSSTKPAEITTHDMDSANVEKGDENSMKNEPKIEESSKNDFRKEIAQNDNKDVEISDQSTLSISGPVISLHKHSNNNDGAHQEAESMDNTPTEKLMMHQEQLLDDATMDTVTETSEAELGEGTVIDEDVFQQEAHKAMAKLVEFVGLPALPSLVKPTEKKEPELPGWSETGMKIEQDRTTNGELKEHDLISKAGAVPGGAVVTMDRRSSYMAVLALMFAMTIGITIIVRLYAPPRATKLQMNFE